MRRLAGLAVAITLCLGASAAGAETTVAVLGIEAADAPMNTANLLTLALQNKVRRTSGFKLVPGKDLDEIKLVFGCVDEKPACMAKAGRSLNAAKLTWGTLKQTPAGFNLTLKWLDVERGRIEKFVSENIGRGELDQSRANRAIDRVTASFLVSNFGMIKVNSNVAGAQVMLGARVVGTTDQDPILLRDVPSGTHLVRVTKDGYRPWTQQVMVQGGETTEVDVEMSPDTGEGEGPIPPPPPPKKGPGNGWKIAFWSGAALTVGLGVGIGISGWQVLNKQNEKQDEIVNFREDYKDAKCTQSDPVARKQCENFADGLLTGDDACSDTDTVETPGNTSTQAIKDACDSGGTMAIVTNVLIGLTVATAAVSGYLYYKAYIAKSSEEAPQDTDTADEPTAIRSPEVRWMVSPRAGPHGGGIGFRLNF